MTSVDDLTLAEKVSLLSGADFWTTQGIDRVGVPSVMLTDGPHGVRKQTGSYDHLGLEDSVPATCFPPAAALGSSFDPELVRRVGAAIGREAAVENIAVVLGPGINIKRSPLCGRNFEYVSEDPLVSGVLGAALIDGIQSQGVGASVKHFAANNQEHDRMRVSSDIDPRPLREIYLRAFERVVKAAAPWTVMCAYNRINGVPASEDAWLLTRVLRDEWGFDGLVVSDWGAVADRLAALVAGLDLEMPGNGGRSDGRVVAAVEAGEIAEEVVDVAAARVRELVAKAAGRAVPDGPFDVAAHHALAQEAAARSIVLLKNDDGLLPLGPGQTVALIGEFARTPRFQGGGSSHVNPTRVDTALDAFRAVSGARVEFAAGFGFGSDASAEPGRAASLREEAVALAARHDVAVLFLGLPDADESEGFDRTHLDLPLEQRELLDAVLQVNPRTVVVLSNGAVVTLPFADRVPAIVEAWLLGQAGGAATVDVLTGAVNPSARLAETIPVRLEDTPAFGSFPGSLGHVRYGEGVFVGYRWYDLRRMPVAYPFGHGLSYTSFAYADPAAHVDETGRLIVTVVVTNTGPVDGREVVQVYIAPTASIVERAPRELKAFCSVEIPAGERREVELVVERDDLAYWDIRVDRFVVEQGEYVVEIGASSRDIRVSTRVAVDGDDLRMPWTLDSSIGELMAHPTTRALLREAFGYEEGEEDDDEGMTLLASCPIGRAPSFPSLGVDSAQVERLIASANSQR